MKRIHLQSGLGDAIFALPFVIALSERFGARLHTKWPEVFKGITGLVIEQTPLAVRQGDIRFQWRNTAKRNYIDMYYDQSSLSNIDFNRYHTLAKQQLTHEPSEILLPILKEAKKSNKPILTYGPPRVAARHQRIKNNQCAARPKEFYEWLCDQRWKNYIIKAGRNEIQHSTETEKKNGIGQYEYISYGYYYDANTTDNLSVLDFITLIRCSDMVASQVSSFTAIAGLFGIPTKVFKAQTETEERHNQHVKETRYPGQVVL